MAVRNIPIHAYLLLVGRSMIFLISIIFFSCGSREKPNVVFVLVDDLGWADLGCYGSEFYDTPNLDRLASQSILFTNAYAASPVCSPTRAAVMTGRHPVRINITDWIPGMDISRAKEPRLETPEDLHNLPLEEVTMAEIFRANGYTTFFAGKWHLGETEEFWPLAQGFDENLGGNHRGSPTFPGGNGYYSPYGNPCLEDGPEGEYLTDRLTSEAIKFIDEHKNDAFFLFLSFYTVHAPIQGCVAYDEYYLEKSQALPDSGRALTRQEHNGITRINQSDPRYAAMVRSLDTNVGRLVNKLNQTGKLNNTILVFTSDNGGLSTTRHGGPTSVLPFRAGKGWCYEGGTRVPLLIRYPGMSNQGSSTDQPAISMDLFPTILELADIPQPRNIKGDGESLVPFLLNPGESKERSMVWHYPHYHGSTWRPGSAIRKGRFKLIEFYEGQLVELYDLSVDPGETEDLSGEYPGKADSLKNEMHQVLDRMGARYPVFKKLN